MRYFLLFLCLITSSIYADYQPAMVFPTSRSADFIDYIKPNRIYKCNDNEKLVNKKNFEGAVVDGTCYSCPVDFPEWDNVIVNDAPDPDRWICQKSCKPNEKRFPTYGTAGYICATCNEIWKEWQGDKCVPKQCPPDYVLDTSTGKCKEYDVKCPEYQDKVYSYTTSRPYCTSFCASNEYRDKKGSCKKIPVCELNQKLTFTEEIIKTTSYKEYKCETVCQSNENEIDGKCFARCNLNEVFEDGQCVSQDGIIRAINRLKNRFTSITYDTIDDLNDLTDSAFFDLVDASDDLDNYQHNNDASSNNDYDLKKLESDTPFFNIDKILDDSIFASRHQCPSDRSFQIWSSSFDFKFSRICGFLHLLSNLVMAISIVLSYFIIRGR